MLLKDKLWNIRNLRVYMSRNWFELDSAKLEVVRSAPTTGAWRETFVEKRWMQSKEIIDWL